MTDHDPEKGPDPGPATPGTDEKSATSGPSDRPRSLSSELTRKQSQDRPDKDRSNHSLKSGSSQPLEPKPSEMRLNPLRQHPTTTNSGSSDMLSASLQDRTSRLSQLENRRASFRSAERDGDGDGPGPDYPSRREEKKLVSRIDWHVLPFLCLMYLLAFLDRVNISNANSFGLSEELGLTSHAQFNISLCIFFIPYVLLEVPSNYILRKTRPNYWLGACMICFGLTTLLQGLVSNFSGLVATRFFLGVFEAGMFPGAFYLIGMWYRRHEAQKRFTFFFASTTIAGAFGGLFASALGLLDGRLGKRGWRWIFWIEGAITVLFGLICIFLLPTFPEDAHWLSREDLAHVQARTRADQGRVQVQPRYTFKKVAKILTDPKIILGGIMYIGLLVPSYSYAYFSPTIIKSDYPSASGIVIQLLSSPPWVGAFLSSMVVAFISDKARHRFLFVIGLEAVAAIGFIVLLCVHNNKNVQYGFLFVIAAGVQAAAPITICWFNMNLGGHLRRSIGTAWQISFGNIGGVIAAFTFLPHQAPYYREGYSICLVFVCVSATAATLYWYLCRRENIIKERNPGMGEAMTSEEKAKLGDLSPDYRYLL